MTRDPTLLALQRPDDLAPRDHNRKSGAARVKKQRANRDRRRIWGQRLRAWVAGWQPAGVR